LGVNAALRPRLLTNKGQMRWRIFDGALNTDILIDFLRRLIKGAGKKLFLILDNLRVHHAKPVKAWLRGQRQAGLPPVPSRGAVAAIEATP
jgi:hypothetical protein